MGSIRAWEGLIGSNIQEIVPIYLYHVHARLLMTPVLVYEFTRHECMRLGASSAPTHLPTSLVTAGMAGPLDNSQTESWDISYALDVEQLDLNLYRSRNLTLPYQARGVFGGQVISQALLAATKCVKPEFALHVRVHSHPTILFLHDPSSHTYIPRRANGQSLHVRLFLAPH